MAQKIIGIYGETAGHSNRLTVEIGLHQFTCLVKNDDTGEIGSFELFQLDNTQHEWNDIFYEIRQYSLLLNKSYTATHLFYNFAEAVLVPPSFNGIVAIEDYLALLYGESDLHEMKQDKTGEAGELTNSYRIPAAIDQLAGKYFPSHHVHHSYSPLVKELLNRPQQQHPHIKIQLYSSHLILAVTKDSQLQLVQSFPYHTTEDILYHLLNTVKQQAIDTHAATLELSGLFDRDSILHRRLLLFFDAIIFDEWPEDYIHKRVTEAGYPAHYFTPFFKLAYYEDHLR